MKKQNTLIYLNGIGAYRREYGDMITKISKKSNFIELLQNRNVATVYVGISNAKKYARMMYADGFILKSKKQYNSDELELYMERVSIAKF